MRIRNVVHAFLALACGGLSAPAADWPRFRGPDGDGICKESGLNKDWNAKPPRELWKIKLTDYGFAGPSVAAGKLFIIDHKGKDDIVRAVDVKTGQDAWTFPYAEAGNDKYGFARSTPTYDDGKLYTLSRAGKLHCLDAETGALVWKRDLRADFQGRTGEWEYAASPLVDGGKLIVCPGGTTSVVALDKKSGQEIWKGGGEDEAGYSTPVAATLNGKRQYLVFNGKALTGVDPDTGALLWRHAWETAYNVNASAPVPIGDSVFISSGYGHGCGLLSLAGGTPSIVWENKEIQQHFNSAILAGGMLYSTTEPGDLVCWDPKTGKTQWRRKGFQKGGLIGIEGALIAIDGQFGDVVLVNQTSKAYEELGRIKPLGGQSWTAPIVADGKLYLRNTQYLVCLDLK